MVSPPRQDERSIDAALEECAGHAQAEGIRLREVLERLGPASFCFACVLLSVPFLQPMSLGPLTLASGVAFMTAGWQMARGRTVPRLPKAMGETLLHGRVWVGLLHFCQRVLKFCRKFTRPRLQRWVVGKTGEKTVGWFILAGGVLFTVPMANLPFNNTFPALMVLFAAIAWLERDGLMLIVSLIWGLATLVYFVVVGAAAWMVLTKALTWLRSLFS